MYESIFYYIGKNTIEIGGEVLPLGTITAEVLNITHEHRQMLDWLKSAEAEMALLLESSDLAHWKTANEYYLKLDAQLCARKTFRLLKQQPDVLAEAQELLSDVEELKSHDFTLSEEDQEILNQIITYEDYLQNPDDYGGETVWESQDLNTGEVFEHHIPQPPIPSPPPAKTKNLLIVSGDIGLKLLVYQRICKGYRNILEDIASFNMTIHNFINGFLSPLIQLNPSNYAASLYDFFNHPRANWLIANPESRTGLFTNADALTMRFIPREGRPGEFQIFEYYEAKNLQTLLKMDFYRALGAGHIIRRCEYCKRYFLLTKGYHTKYCDLPNPENPSFTCRQLGYRKTGRKEEAKDDPMKQSLFRCYQRLTQDVKRGNLSDKQRQILYHKAEELHFDARLNPNISNAEFEKSLETKNLCKLCSVERKSGKVGRPRKTKAI